MDSASSSNSSFSTEEGKGNMTWKKAIVIAYWILQHKNPEKKLFCTARELSAPIQKLQLIQHSNSNPSNHIRFLINNECGARSNLTGQRQLFYRQKHKSLICIAIDERNLEQYLRREKVEEEQLLAWYNAFYNTRSKKPATLKKKTGNISQALSQHWSLTIGEIGSVERPIELDSDDVSIQETKLNQSLYKLNLFLKKCQEEPDPAFKSLLNLTQYTQKILEQFQNFRLGTDDVCIVFLGRTGVGKSFLCNLFIFNIFPQEYSSVFKDDLLCAILESHSIIADLSSFDHEKVFDEQFILSTFNSPHCKNFYEGEVENEKKSDDLFKQVLQSFHSTGTLTDGQHQILSKGSFLFPSKNHLESTTSFPIIIKGGIIPALIVKYFSVHEYKLITGKDVDSHHPKQPYEHYFAKGKNLSEDRMYIKYLIKKYFENENLCSYIKEMIVYVPVDMLIENQVQLIDAPGSDDASEMHTYQRSRILNLATHINVILEKNLQQSNNVLVEIETCNFYSKIIMEPMKYSISFITCMEKNILLSKDNLTNRLNEAHQSATHNKEYFLTKLKTHLNNPSEGMLKQISSEKEGVDDLLQLYESNVESYYCFPLLFSSLCFDGQVSDRIDGSALEVIKKSNMMLLYGKTYQIEQYRLLWALKYLDDNFLSPLNHFFQNFSLQITGLDKLKHVSIVDEVDIDLTILEDSIQTKLERYFEMDYQKFSFEDKIDQKTSEMRITIAKQSIAWDDLFDVKKLPGDCRFDMVYEVVTELSDDLFQKCIKLCGENEHLVLDNLVVFSFYIRVVLYEYIDQLLPQMPTERDARQVIKSHFDSTTRGTVKQAKEKLLDGLKSQMCEEWTNRFYLSDHFKTLFRNIWNDFNSLINKNVGNRSGSIILLDKMLGIEKTEIEQLAEKLVSYNSHFSNLYEEFSKSKECFIKLVDVPMKQMIVELLEMPLLYPKSSHTGFNVTCYGDECKLGKNGQMHNCNCCRKWYHISCTNSHLPSDKQFTYDQVHRADKSFCYVCQNILFTEQELHINDDQATPQQAEENDIDLNIVQVEGQGLVMAQQSTRKRKRTSLTTDEETKNSEVESSAKKRNDYRREMGKKPESITYTTAKKKGYANVHDMLLAEYTNEFS